MTLPILELNDTGMLHCPAPNFRVPLYLRCSQSFITKRDVEIVRRSTKGLGTNEARLIGTLCNRTKKQLDAVDALYHKTVGRRRIGCCEMDSPGVHHHVFRGFLIRLARRRLLQFLDCRVCVQHNMTLHRIISHFYA